MLQYMPLRSKVRHSNLYPKIQAPVHTAHPGPFHQLGPTVTRFRPVCRCPAAPTQQSPSAVQLYNSTDIDESTIPVPTTLCKPSVQTALRCYWGLLVMSCHLGTSVVVPIPYPAVPLMATLGRSQKLWLHKQSWASFCA